MTDPLHQEQGPEAGVQSVALTTGISMEYALAGQPEAPCLCFIHGLGAGLRQFLPQQAHFGQAYQVLLLSLRGHGGSTSPEVATPEAYTPRALAQDVQALLDWLGIQELHIVGNSLGGLVAYELLELCRPRLLSLTTFGTTAELHSPRLTYGIVAGLVRLLGPRRIAALVGRTATRDPAVGAQLQAMYETTSKEALLQIPRHIADYDYTPVLRRSRMPLLLIQGSLDRGINATLGSTLAALNARPHSRVIRLKDAGHFANMEKPEEFNSILNAFLGEQQDEAGLQRRQLSQPDMSRAGPSDHNAFCPTASIVIQCEQ